MGLFERLFSHREKRRLSQSLSSPFVVPYQRDAFRYYESGRSTTIDAELMFGEYDRLVHYGGFLKWDDNGAELTRDEEKRAFERLVQYLNQRKIKWKFSEAGTPPEFR